jgi:hypothetical protein
MYLFLTLAVNHGHFLLLMLKLEFDADFINVFFELIVNYKRVRFFFVKIDFFHLMALKEVIREN